MTELDAAKVLEEAADLLLIRGVERHSLGWGDNGPRCTIGAIAEVMDLVGCADFYSTAKASPAARAVEAAVGHVPAWNDSTTDDFEVIDTLRLVAKDLRNEASAR